MIVKLCLLVLLAISSINAPGDRLDAESADDKIFLHYGSRSKPDSARTVKDDSRRGRSTSTHRDYVSMPANSCFSSNLSTAAVGACMYNFVRSEEHTSELQSRGHLVCRLLLEK